MLSTLDIMTCMKKGRFSSRPKVKVGHQGRAGSARAQPCFCKKWGPLEKRVEGIYLFWAALQTPILHPLYSADHSYTY